MKTYGPISVLSQCGSSDCTKSNATTLSAAAQVSARIGPVTTSRRCARSSSTSCPRQPRERRV